ncbi:hypothetical protein ACFO9Q_14745 [Paenibacillus sp. GCM10023252]|uniref:hypothetical protein n=1 Tax=Paenibacillus sp. GCM10023252 TaxID=3252649 RepID=UPI00360C17C7
MPKLLIPARYDATFKAAKRVFQEQPNLLSKYSFTLDSGSPLYRFVGYRNSKPQLENAGRTIWTSLQNDWLNRWTGRGTDSPDGKITGKQAIYLSMEEEGPVDTSFPEVTQYQDSSVDPNETIRYFEYEPGKKPAWVEAKASELRSMFLFSTTRPLEGIDLTYDDSPDSIHSRIYELACSLAPDVFKNDSKLRELYFSSEDASYNRAIGNALFETTIYGAFKATSVRDFKSINLVLSGSQGTPISLLAPLGRATFLLDGTTRKTRAVYTIDDLIYNQSFETSNPNLQPKEELVKELHDYVAFTQTIDRELDWNYAAELIDQEVNAYVSDALHAAEHPFERELGLIVDELSTEAFNERMRRKLEEFTAAAAAGSDSYLPTLKEIGREGMDSLLDAIVVEPRYKRLSEPSTETDSYLRSALKSTLLEKKMHWLEQTSSDIGSRLAAAQTTVTETSMEASAKGIELERINEKLKEKPNDPDLQKQQQALSQQIGHLVQEQQEAEQAKSEAEQDRKRNEKDRKDTSKERAEAEAKLQAQREHDFSTGARV